eukprot:7423055-Ditylum_brightwellii.AAC.2
MTGQPIWIQPSLTSSYTTNWLEVSAEGMTMNQQDWYPTGQCCGTDKQAKQIKEECATKICKCNSKFAQDITDESFSFENDLKHS